jgi:hypothetical protein
MPTKKARRTSPARGGKNTKKPVKKGRSGITKGPAKSNTAPPKSALKKSTKSVLFVEERLSNDSEPAIISASISATTNSTMSPVILVLKKPAYLMILLHVYLDNNDLLYTIYTINLNANDSISYDNIQKEAKKHITAAIAKKAPGKIAD